MTDLLTIPAAPTVGAYTTTDFTSPQNNTATQQRENYVTVATNEFDGQYTNLYDAYEAVKGADATIFIKEGTYYIDMPSEQIVFDGFNYSFIGAAQGSVTLKFIYKSATLKPLFEGASATTGNISLRNINIEHDNDSNNTSAIYRAIGVVGSSDYTDTFEKCNFTCLDPGSNTVSIVSIHRNVSINCCYFKDGGINLAGPSTETGTIKTVSDSNFYVEQGESISMSSDKVTIENCLFEDYDSTCISVTAAKAGQKTYINNNKLLRGSLSGVSNKIDIYASTRFCEITNNEIVWAESTTTNHDVQSIAVNSPSTTTDEGSLKVLGNKIEIEYTTTATAATNFSSGISMENKPTTSGPTAAALVADNQVLFELIAANITTPSVAGIICGNAAVSSAEKVQVNGNYTNTPGSVTNRYGVYLINDFNIVTGNRLINHTTAIRSVGGGDVITPNIVV